MPDEIAHFLKFVKVTSACWLWLGAKAGNGYGVFRPSAKIYGRMMVYAHRFIYQLLIGSIPKDYLVLHRCDRPACVRPSHLFVGTQKDNMQDCAKKRRTTFGEHSASARLTEKNVKEIRLLGKCGMLHRQIAKKFNVARPTISLILERRNWKHV